MDFDQVDFERGWILIVYHYTYVNIHTIRTTDLKYIHKRLAKNNSSYHITERENAKNCGLY